MVVFCQECETHYDDARCWTICPHNPLDRGADQRACRRHDLFGCNCPADRIMIELRSYAEVPSGRPFVATSLLTGLAKLHAGDAYRALIYLWRRTEVEVMVPAGAAPDSFKPTASSAWRLSDWAVMKRR